MSIPPLILGILITKNALNIDSEHQKELKQRKKVIVYLSFFSHPDFTVGVGIEPTQLALADYTAGRELHPALKNIKLRNYINMKK